MAVSNTLKLYHSTSSPNSRRVRIFMAEKGLDLTLVPEEAYPTRPLLGKTPKEKALVSMWERRAELEGFAAVMEGVRNAAAV